MTTNNGILAIWNTCAVGQEAVYETWYQTEHLYERLAVDGFRRGRRYESANSDNSFFTYYETDSPAVLTSDYYLQRVNDPTPMTANIMGNAFTDMSRTVCRQQFVLGRMRGAFAATIQMSRLPQPSQLSEWMASQNRDTSIARVEGWLAEDSAVPESTEARIRGGDEQIDACLFVETLRMSDCHAAIAQLASDFNLPESKPGVFRLLCELTP